MVQPLWAQSARWAPTADEHVSHWASASSVTWGSQLWLDPGAEDVHTHAVAVVSDVLTRYDIDGVHMDDYFYPYPQGGQEFPDNASFQTYLDGGGTLDKSAWRRENVDSLVEDIATLVHTEHPNVRFGISPFGIYRNGVPEGIRGLDQVTALNADPMKWYDEGWVDYLAPQLYWSTQREAQRYDRLLDWWDGEMVDERPLMVGMDCTKVGNDSEWTLEEMRTQVDLARQASSTTGQIWFRATPVLSNQAGVGDLVGKLYARPAAPPVLARAADTVVRLPVVHATSRGVTLDYRHRRDLRGFVLYENTDSGWVARDVLGAHTLAVAAREGEWAVSALHRTGVETQGVRLPQPFIKG